ncbi:MAG TPA: AI-2E family transporter [Chloroflexota bacterium]
MQNRPATRTGIDWARTRDVLISVIALGIILSAAGQVLRHVLQTVLIFIVASFVAFALVPLVNGLASRGVPRLLAITIVYLSLLVIIIFGGYWIGGQLVTQITGLVTQLPQSTTAVEGFVAQVQTQLSAHGITINLQDQINGAVAGLQTQLTNVLSQSLKIVSGLTTAIISIVLVIFFSIYLVADAQLISQNAPRLVPRRYQRIIRFIQVTMTEKVGGFIRGQVIMAIIIAVSTGVVATILHVRYSLILGVLAFFFELIPTIGPILIGLSLALVAVFQGVVVLIEVLVFYVVLNTIESNVLGPRIVGQAVGLPAFVSLVAIVAGAEAGGILGALFAVPATALVVTLAGAAIEEWKEQSAAVPEALPPEVVTAAAPTVQEGAPQP